MKDRPENESLRFLSPPIQKEKSSCHGHDDSDEDEKWQKLNRCIEKLMIEPNNKKLRIFNIIASCSFIIDIYLTGFMNANYYFVTAEDIEFLDHENIYFYIITI